MENTHFPNPDPQNLAMPGNAAAQTQPAGIPGADIQKPEREKPEESPRTRFMKDHFSWFAGTACLYAFLYTFCLYDNPAGITCPAATAGTILFSVLWIRRAGLAVKRGLIFYFTGMMLLGISTCLTASSWFHLFNAAGILLLFFAAMLHQFYEDGRWSFPVYLKQFLLFFGTCAASLPQPIQHMLYHISQRKANGNADQKKQASSVLAGTGIAALFLLCVLPLLIGSDQVFARYFLNCFSAADLGSGVQVFFCFLTGFLLLYVSFAALFRQNLKEHPKKERRAANALTGITFTAIIALIYVPYSGIQILYLFLRRGLPDGMTYSQYAHQGFWQLLAVSLINIITVLACIQAFEGHRALKLLLLVISVCTCVMTVSAAYRMMLYVEIYHLTFLRVLVLWFLGLLTLILGGVMVGIFWRRFRLFQYSVTVVACCYIVFSFAKVDGLIASYNIRHASQITWQDVFYLMHGLSEDAAPYIEELSRMEIENYAFTEDDRPYYRETPYEYTSQEDLSQFETIGDYLEPEFQYYMEQIAGREEPSLRKWNLSQARARKIAEAYLEKHGN